MENLCLIRDIYRYIRDFEVKFQHFYELSFNEGMLLCSLKDQIYSSSKIAEILGLTLSNASKTIKSAEDKGLVERMMGQEDKRQMYFILTKKGYSKLEDIKDQSEAIEYVVEKIRTMGIETKEEVTEL